MLKKDMILDQINNVRYKMIALANDKGYTHKDTVIISQLLDNLLNEYRTAQKGEL